MAGSGERERARSHQGSAARQAGHRTARNLHGTCTEPAQNPHRNCMGPAQNPHRTCMGPAHNPPRTCPELCQLGGPGRVRAEGALPALKCALLVMKTSEGKQCLLCGINSLREWLADVQSQFSKGSPAPLESCAKPFVGTQRSGIFELSVLSGLL